MSDIGFDIDGFLRDLDRAPAAEIKAALHQVTRRRYRSKGLAIKACRRKLMRQTSHDELRSVLLQTVTGLSGTTRTDWASRLGTSKRAKSRAESAEAIVAAYLPRGGPVATTSGRPKPSTAQSGEFFHSRRFKMTFELVRRIRGGGMAEAWEARDVGTDRRVFLKRVPLRGTDQKALAREARTYQTLARARFEHVLDVVAFDQDEVHAALVTEWADGGTLQDYCDARVALPLRQVVNVGVEIGEGISALHAAGFVHRDLKPGNVLRHGNQWKLADLGIAKNLQRTQTVYTLRGAHTPGYASPEQRWYLAEAQPSADVYSFGKVLVYLATQETDVDLVSELGLWRLCRSCMRENPDDRPSMKRVLVVLRALIAHGGAHT